MGLPAFLISDAWLLELPPGVDRTEAERLRDEIRALLERVRRARPEDESAEERASILQYVEVTIELVRLLGGSFLGLVRSKLQDALKALLSKELDASEIDRKFALRQIQQAADRLATLAEQPADLTDVNAVAAAARDLLDRLKRPGVAVPQEERVILRFQLDLFVALEVLDAPLDELCYWAFRAVTGSRKVSHMLRNPALVNAWRARDRARSAWTNWDDEEIATELAPWPKTRRSP